MKIKRLFLPLFLLLGSASFVTACGNGKVDYVSQCKLDSSLKYSTNNFLDNGIGEVTLKKCIDGDTSHFNQKEATARLVKIRYIGVDTPESTGQIEKWGKAASNFTKSKLESAKTIVLTTDINDIGSAATVDSTGSRYKGLVWISEKANASISELKCLNLWLVQEGFSTGKGLSGSPLSKYFTDADLQAQKLKLHIWSDDDDPLFYGGPAIATDIKTLVESYNKDADESDFNSERVTVKGVVVKTSGEYDCFIADYVDGVEYGLYIFAGYKSYAPLRTVGNYIQITGNFTVYYGNPQLTNVKYSGGFFDSNDDDIKILETGRSVSIKEATIDEVSNKLAVNRVVTMNNLYIYGGYTEIDQTSLKPSGALTLRARDENQKQISVRVPDDVWVEVDGVRIREAEYFFEKTISLTGCVNFYAPDEENQSVGYYQIKLCLKTDFSLVA